MWFKIAHCLLLYSFFIFAAKVKNPILLAQEVLENSPHCLLVAEGAERFATQQNISLISNETLITNHAKKAWDHYKQVKLDPLSTAEVEYVLKFRNFSLIIYSEMLVIRRFVYNLAKN